MTMTSPALRECTWCGVSFRPGRGYKLYCSELCAMRMQWVSRARMADSRRDTGVMRQEMARQVGDVLAGIADQEAPTLPTRPGSCPRCRSRLLTYTNSTVRRGIGEARCTTSVVTTATAGRHTASGAAMLCTRTAMCGRRRPPMARGHVGGPGTRTGGRGEGEVMRTGDIVYHWPPGEAYAEHCTLMAPATEREHREAVMEFARKAGASNSNDRRYRWNFNYARRMAWME